MAPSVGSPVASAEGSGVDGTSEGETDGVGVSDGDGEDVPGGAGGWVSVTPTAGPRSAGAGLRRVPIMATPTAMTAPALAAVMSQVCTCDRFMIQVSPHIMRCR